MLIQIAICLCLSLDCLGVGFPLPVVSLEETDDPLIASVEVSHGEGFRLNFEGQRYLGKAVLASAKNLLTLEASDKIAIYLNESRWFDTSVGEDFDFIVRIPKLPLLRGSWLSMTVAIFSAEFDFVGTSGPIRVEMDEELERLLSSNDFDQIIGRSKSPKVEEAKNLKTDASISSGEGSHLDLQREFVLKSRIRDAETGSVQEKEERLSAANVALVLMDTWDYHWCMTLANRAAALTPRINKITEAARHLGIQIFWSPTDVAEAHAGDPARERAVAAIWTSGLHEHGHDHLHHHHYEGLHKHNYGFNASFENPKCPSQLSGCACGPYARQCLYHQGIRRINSGLTIDKERDVVVDGAEELDLALARRGITHLIYGGVHANECILNKRTAMRAMSARGYATLLARDITDSACYRSRSIADLDAKLKHVITQLEKSGVHTVNMGAVLEESGFWSASIVDSVRIAPWGTAERPFLTDHPVMAVISFPGVVSASNISAERAMITYTTDGTEPMVSSTTYSATAGIQIFASMTITAAAFDLESKSRLTLFSSSVIRYLRQSLIPDVRIADLTPLRMTSFRSSSYAATRSLVGANNDVIMGFKTSIGFTGKRASTRRLKVADVISVHAPAQMMYAVKPEYKEFVGSCFVDEGLLEHDYGFMTSSIPSVVCKVFVDGVLAEESPVMKLFLEEYRFRVAIPAGARVLSMVVTDAGDGNRLDMAVWHQSGFIL